ncbi:Protein EMSY-LIKE 3 [Quillaja saponaria]|uniref:Protein EMSY-LIKE 3 n=1 Tax=Quillaja saponaria TaxID=32244 RepID=A0AAD7VHN1_QUISA|nr:Protein EMSY-LIKE 3 [Quillaja saponaria]
MDARKRGRPEACYNANGGFKKSKQGTDDDLPPSYQKRVPRGSSVAGNERSAVGSVSYSRIHGDMEAQIHCLEQEAYSSVLCAFKAQSDALSWEKEGLITELRKELRVSDDEHREILSRVNNDDIIHRIREWRKGGDYQPAKCSTSHPVHDVLPSPTVSASRKKQKTSQLQVQPLPDSLMRSRQYNSASYAGNRHFTSRSSSGNVVPNVPDLLIGKKVWTRWPADNHFYEAVITDYNSAEGRHALVYNINTANETWEWVDLKEISPEDIQWEGDDHGISHQGGHGGQGHAVNKYSNHIGNTLGAGRGRRHPKVQSGREFFPSQNGIGKRSLDDIEFLYTDSLVKEVERVFAVSHPDPLELEKAKNLLEEQEQALVDAIARLVDASDG